jgi:hypothetical protein
MVVSLSDLHLGVLFYHAQDFRERPEILRPLLAAVEAVLPERKLVRFKGMLDASDKFTREISLPEKSMQQLLVDLKGSIYSVLQFYDRPGSARDAKVAGADLTVSLARPSRHAGLYSGDLKVVVPVSLVRSLDALRESLVTIMELLNSPYGFAHLGPGWEPTVSELSAIPISTGFAAGGSYFTNSDDALRSRETERLFSIQGQRSSLGDKIRGPYWWTFLGDRLAGSLGGVHSITREAPVEVVRSIMNSGALLQVTSDLPADVAHSAPQELERLARYLAPISI